MKTTPNDSIKKAAIEELKAKAQKLCLDKHPHRDADDFYDAGLELFGLEHMSYNSETNRMAIALVYSVFYENKDGINEFASFELAESFGFEPLATEVMTYALSTRKDACGEDLFEYGGSPRCMWPTAAGKKVYERFIRIQSGLEEI